LPEGKAQATEARRSRGEKSVLALNLPFDPVSLGLLEQGAGRCWGQDGRIDLRQRLKLEQTPKLLIRTELPHRA
jgi:hypothetical protein